MKDMSKIGSGTQQNPQDAIEAETGKYKDAVESVPVEERLGTNVWPKGEDPSPIKGAH